VRFRSTVGSTLVCVHFSIGAVGIVNLSGLGTFVTAQSVVSSWSQCAVTVRHTEKDRDRKNR
jgi:hypothetical protein